MGMHTFFLLFFFLFFLLFLFVFLVFFAFYLGVFIPDGRTKSVDMPSVIAASRSH